MTTKQLELWQGEFGDQYTERNMFGEIEIQQRMNLWATIGIGINSQPKTILEVGAGSGVNLVAIDRLCKNNHINMTLHAVEPNEKARKILKEQGDFKLINFNAFDIQLEKASMDVVFTSGVLIHIPPGDGLLNAMREIYRVARRTIVCIEYFAPELREIKYRGQDQALWVQDYGSLWQDNFKLACTGYGFFWKRMAGLDNITYWIFEKVN